MLHSFIHSRKSLPAWLLFIQEIYLFISCHIQSSPVQTSVVIDLSIYRSVDQSIDSSGLPIIFSFLSNIHYIHTIPYGQMGRKKSSIWIQSILRKRASKKKQSIKQLIKESEFPQQCSGMEGFVFCVRMHVGLSVSDFLERYLWITRLSPGG